MRPTVPVDSAIAESLSHQPHQESRLVMREFMSAFGKLAPTQREALLLAVLEGQSYEVIAAHTGVSVGTVKSRISLRARHARAPAARRRHQGAQRYRQSPVGSCRRRENGCLYPGSLTQLPQYCVDV